MKKHKYFLMLSICLLAIFNINKTNIFASISDDFKFVIDTIGIPEYNVYNEQINEQIYYKYNTFVYSDPISISLTVPNQRFKAVDDLGKWVNDNKIQGEYNILGRDYNGALVYNVYFPVDAVSETTPDKWDYVNIPGAYDSWNDTSKYKYIEQLEYMKNSKLLFDNINFEKNISNQYDLIKYNITASDIGLGKVLLGNCATWKTMGIVTVKRKNNKNMLRDATLAVEPMEASAKIESNLYVNTDVEINEYQDEIQIPIEFGAQVVDMKNYANVKHIKNITSKLYVNDREFSTISGSKTVKVDKNNIITVSRNDNTLSNYTINLKVKSYLYTEFNVDGLLQDTIEKTINIKIIPKKINPILNISIGNLKKYDSKMVVSPLVQTNITQDATSAGFAESGKHLAVKLELLPNIDKEAVTFSSYLNDIKISNSVILLNNSSAILDIFIPENFVPTLKTWATLRNANKNYFNIDFKQIGIRQSQPNVLRITTDEKLDKDMWSNIRFDNIDNYKENINYIFNNQVINKNNINQEIAIEEWANEK